MGSLTQTKYHLARGIQKSMIHKKLCCIPGVSLEPVSGISKPKTVAPGVHVEHKLVSPNTVDMIGQYDLQVTNSRLLKIVATCVTIKTISPVLCHTNDVAGFMK